jgi:hypothetical protein
METEHIDHNGSKHACPHPRIGACRHRTRIRNRIRSRVAMRSGRRIVIDWRFSNLFASKSWRVGICPAGSSRDYRSARIDGSVGWFSMIANGGALVTPSLPKESYEEVYKDGQDVIIAGSAIPLGTAEQIDDSWLVNGRWPFASGCMYAGWMLGLCVLTSGGKPVRGATEGRPPIRAFLLPARRGRSRTPGALWGSKVLAAITSR